MIAFPFVFLKKKFLPVLVTLCCGMFLNSNAQPAAVPKTNPVKVYMHYMPWFDAPQNPVANGLLTVSAPGMSGNVTAQITDAKGSLLKKENKQVQNEKLNINVSQLKGGVYILQLRNNDKIITGKFMVK